MEGIHNNQSLIIKQQHHRRGAKADPMEEVSVLATAPPKPSSPHNPPQLPSSHHKVGSFLLSRSNNNSGSTRKPKQASESLSTRSSYEEWARDDDDDDEGLVSLSEDDEDEQEYEEEESHDFTTQRHTGFLGMMKKTFQFGNRQRTGSTQIQQDDEAEHSDDDDASSVFSDVQEEDRDHKDKIDGNDTHGRPPANNHRRRSDGSGSSSKAAALHSPLYNAALPDTRHPDSTNVAAQLANDPLNQHGDPMPPVPFRQRHHSAITEPTFETILNQPRRVRTDISAAASQPSMSSAYHHDNNSTAAEAVPQTPYSEFTRDTAGGHTTLVSEDTTTTATTASSYDVTHSGDNSNQSDEDDETEMTQESATTQTSSVSSYLPSRTSPLHYRRHHRYSFGHHHGRGGGGGVPPTPPWDFQTQNSTTSSNYFGDRDGIRRPEGGSSSTEETLGLIRPPRVPRPSNLNKNQNGKRGDHKWVNHRHRKNLSSPQGQTPTQEEDKPTIVEKPANHSPKTSDTKQNNNKPTNDGLYSTKHSSEDSRSNKKQKAKEPQTSIGWYNFKTLTKQQMTPSRNETEIVFDTDAQSNSTSPVSQLTWNGPSLWGDPSPPQQQEDPMTGREPQRFSLPPEEDTNKRTDMEENDQAANNNEITEKAVDKEEVTKTTMRHNHYQQSPAARRRFLSAMETVVEQQPSSLSRTSSSHSAAADSRVHNTSNSSNDKLHTSVDGSDPISKSPRTTAKSPSPRAFSFRALRGRRHNLNIHEEPETGESEIVFEGSASTNAATEKEDPQSNSTPMTTNEKQLMPPAREGKEGSGDLFHSPKLWDVPVHNNNETLNMTVEEEGVERTVSQQPTLSNNSGSGTSWDAGAATQSSLVVSQNRIRNNNAPSFLCTMPSQYETQTDNHVADNHQQDKQWNKHKMQKGRSPRNRSLRLPSPKALLRRNNSGSKKKNRSFTKEDPQTFSAERPLLLLSSSRSQSADHNVEPEAEMIVKDFPHHEEKESEKELVPTSTEQLTEIPDSGPKTRITGGGEENMDALVPSYNESGVRVDPMLSLPHGIMKSTTQASTTNILSTLFCGTEEVQSGFLSNDNPSNVTAALHSPKRNEQDDENKEVNECLNKETFKEHPSLPLHFATKHPSRIRSLPVGLRLNSNDDPMTAPPEPQEPELKQHKIISKESVQTGNSVMIEEDKSTHEAHDAVQLCRPHSNPIKARISTPRPTTPTSPNSISSASSSKNVTRNFSNNACPTPKHAHTKTKDACDEIVVVETPRHDDEVCMKPLARTVVARVPLRKPSTSSKAKAKQKKAGVWHTKILSDPVVATAKPPASIPHKSPLAKGNKQQKQQQQQQQPSLENHSSQSTTEKPTVAGMRQGFWGAIVGGAVKRGKSKMGEETLDSFQNTPPAQRRSPSPAPRVTPFAVASSTILEASQRKVSQIKKKFEPNKGRVMQMAEQLEEQNKKSQSRSDLTTKTSSSQKSLKRVDFVSTVEEVPLTTNMNSTKPTRSYSRSSSASFKPKSILNNREESLGDIKGDNGEVFLSVQKLNSSTNSEDSSEVLQQVLMFNPVESRVSSSMADHGEPDQVWQPHQHHQPPASANVEGQRTRNSNNSLDELTADLSSPYLLKHERLFEDNRSILSQEGLEQTLSTAEADILEHKTQESLPPSQPSLSENEHSISKKQQDNHTRELNESIDPSTVEAPSHKSLFARWKNQTKLLRSSSPKPNNNDETEHGGSLRTKIMMSNGENANKSEGADVAAIELSCSEGAMNFGESSNHHDSTTAFPQKPGLNNIFKRFLKSTGNEASRAEKQAKTQEKDLIGHEISSSQRPSTLGCSQAPLEQRARSTSPSICKRKKSFNKNVEQGGSVLPAPQIRSEASSNRSDLPLTQHKRKSQVPRKFSSPSRPRQHVDMSSRVVVVNASPRLDLHNQQCETETLKEIQLKSSRAKSACSKSTRLEIESGEQVVGKCSAFSHPTDMDQVIGRRISVSHESSSNTSVNKKDCPSLKEENLNFSGSRGEEHDIAAHTSNEPLLDEYQDALSPRSRKLETAEDKLSRRLAKDLEILAKIERLRKEGKGTTLNNTIDNRNSLEDTADVLRGVQALVLKQKNARRHQLLEENNKSKSQKSDDEVEEENKSLKTVVGSQTSFETFDTRNTMGNNILSSQSWAGDVSNGLEKMLFQCGTPTHIGTNMNDDDTQFY